MFHRFYFPGILVGPYLDFPEYMELINETMFQHAHVKATLKAGHRLPPGRKRAAYTKMIMGLIYLGAFVVLGGKYNYSISLTDEFAKMSLLKRSVGPYVVYQHTYAPLVSLCTSSVVLLNAPNIMPSGL